MGKGQRDKGAAGENEVKNLAKDYGLEAERTGDSQAKSGSKYADVVIEGIKYEVKRDENRSVDKMIEEAKRSNSVGLLWRRNREDWRVDLPATYYFALLYRLKNESKR